MTTDRLRAVLEPFVLFPEAAPLPPDLYSQLSIYLDLLLRWNARTNLTAIREPEEIVTRHFGEGLFTALQLRSYLPKEATLLDVGSGAGFPGLPIQLAIPELRVTLAESQVRKSSFLREVVRVLGLGTEVWAGRVEDLPPHRRFSAVTLRAVDRMRIARDLSLLRVAEGGILAELVAEGSPSTATLEPLMRSIVVPGSHRRVLRIWLPSGRVQFHVEQLGPR